MNVITNEIIKNIIEEIESIKFGYVQIIIQDSKVVQIDKMEKVRLKNSEIKKGGDVIVKNRA